MVEQNLNSWTTPNIETGVGLLSVRKGNELASVTGATDPCANCGAGTASLYTDVDGDLSCVICGRLADDGNGVVSKRDQFHSAVVQVLRYGGQLEALKELTVPVVFIYMSKEFVASRRYWLHAICPWCGQPTNRVHVSWVRTLQQRWRLECPQRHAVNLVGESGYPEYWW